jgi:hypothetical protein
MRIVLHRSGDLIVALSQLLAYPTGLEFTLEFRSRQPRDHSMPMVPHFAAAHGQFRFGVEFADGRRAIAGAHFAPGRDPLASPEGPVLISGGGGGGANRWDQRMWLWPLPPEGPLRVAIELPASGVPETVVEVDSAPIRAAAREAEQLWEPEVGVGIVGGWQGGVIGAVRHTEPPD